MSRPLNASEILAMLDAAAARFTFPVLDNGYVYPADVRLSGFASGEQWALVIEVLGFNTRAGVGNCIPKGQEGQEGFRLDFVFPVDDGSSGELLGPGPVREEHHGREPLALVLSPSGRFAPRIG